MFNSKPNKAPSSSECTLYAITSILHLLNFLDPIPSIHICPSPTLFKHLNKHKPSVSLKCVGQLLVQPLVARLTIHSGYSLSCSPPENTELSAAVPHLPPGTIIFQMAIIYKRWMPLRSKVWILWPPLLAYPSRWLCSQVNLGGVGPTNVVRHDFYQIYMIIQFLKVTIINYCIKFTK